MRLLLAVLVVVLVGGFLVFLAGNLQTTVAVTWMQTRYEDVPLWLVVLAAIATSLVLISVYGIAEGAGIRLENRRLRRELHKLETEINYLRTRPSSATVPEPDAIVPAAAAAAGEDAERDESPPSAPVYGNGDAWAPDTDDDDVYSGGRAV